MDLWRWKDEHVLQDEQVIRSERVSAKDFMIHEKNLLSGKSQAVNVCVSEILIALEIKPSKKMNVK